MSDQATTRDRFVKWQQDTAILDQLRALLGVDDNSKIAHAVQALEQRAIAAESVPCFLPPDSVIRELPRYNAQGQPDSEGEYIRRDDAINVFLAPQEEL